MSTREQWIEYIVIGGTQPEIVLPVVPMPTIDDEEKERELFWQFHNDAGDGK